MHNFGANRCLFVARRCNIPQRTQGPVVAEGRQGALWVRRWGGAIINIALAASSEHLSKILQQEAVGARDHTAAAQRPAEAIRETSITHVAQPLCGLHRLHICARCPRDHLAYPFVSLKNHA